MNAVCVLGDGQLSRMLRQAGEPLGIEVFAIGAHADPNTIPFETSIITAEIERWPDTTFTQKLATHPHFINKNVFPLISNRGTQKKLLDDLNLPTAPWSALDTPKQLPAILERFDADVIVKRRIGGYDGRGQYHVTPENITTLPQEVYGQAIVEQRIFFEGEVSLVGARNRKGKCVFYPLTHNYHENGILKVSAVKPHKSMNMQEKAEAMLTRLMDHIDYIGVMAMEFFCVGDALLINELAPRVHNSGHWTQNGASINQFELHLRAILDLPLLQPDTENAVVMINLIGLPRSDAWLSLPNVHLHWYDKIVRENRKVGHLNVTHKDKHVLLDRLDQCQRHLPPSYVQALGWAKQILMSA